MKIELKIDGKEVSLESGCTVLDAARSLSVEIPTLCHSNQCAPETSCMLCVVKNRMTDQLIPACSAKAVEGMEIDTECDEVQSARRDILNLLLSEHVGDCEAPCTRVCPAHLDIPLMLREIERGNMESAAWIARRDLALPVSLGYICPAPCEKGCRRKDVDSALKIKESHRNVCESFQPLETHFPDLGQRVAVIGSGPAGLSSAWKLRQLGYACTIYDEALHAGGNLREHPDLPIDVLDDEIEQLWRTGIEFKLGEPVSLHEIADGFDGVIFAANERTDLHFSDAFYAEEHALTVKAVANGKKAALELHTHVALDADPMTGKMFDSKIGRLRESELSELTLNCSEESFVSEWSSEAARCLHCDCRKPVSCKLRNYAEKYGADQREFPADERGHIQLIGQNEKVVFEPGKCIKCGLCVTITKQAGEDLGLTFVGRGFNVKISVPFGGKLQDGLQKAAEECVNNCPTGALAFSDYEEKIRS